MKKRKTISAPYPIIIGISIALSVFTCACATDKQESHDARTGQEPKHTNALRFETSPYLLQHAHNPVNWYSWGDEALKKAKAENKPIFLSIGYASCHWCHVMERESFENEDIAELLNRYFICIKVDREERPDIDHIYMSVTTLMTGHGGWPMTVFLTPDLKPFYAGTYFPPDDRNGQPGLRRLITELARIYRDEPARIKTVSGEVFRQLQANMVNSTSSRAPDTAFIIEGANQLLQRIDPMHSGFGTGHEFPQATQLGFLLRRFHSTGDSTYLWPVVRTLEVMQRGGIFDQVGGGFHRYTVDRQWMIPHFEKMLYDNALLTLLYVEAYQLTKNPSYRETVRRTLDFLLREMQGANGEFFSAIDADSEGEEGKFYVWASPEIDRILEAIS
ncbi:MAG: thioredoxin domain-containing protein [Candidatus Zixiibacteriota bacterium]